MHKGKAERFLLANLNVNIISNFLKANSWKTGKKCQRCY